MIMPFLAERDPAELPESSEFLWLVGGLVVTLLVGAIAFSWLERWRKRQVSDSPAAEIEQFGTYREMFERGELTSEEYDRIKRKEAERLKARVLGKPLKPTPPVPPVQPATQEPETPPPTK